MDNYFKRTACLFALPFLLTATTAFAHKLHRQGEETAVAESTLTVRPSRDWNQLGKRIGKNTETWTLDGPQLNDVTFFGGIAPGKPLVKEKDKKREPLPKFTKNTLLAEIPELLERTTRAYMLITCACAAIHIARGVRHLHTAKPGRFFEVCPLIEIDQSITERLGFRHCSLWRFFGDLGWLCS